MTHLADIARYPQLFWVIFISSLLKYQSFKKVKSHKKVDREVKKLPSSPLFSRIFYIKLQILKRFSIGKLHSWNSGC